MKSHQVNANAFILIFKMLASAVVDTNYSQIFHDMLSFQPTFSFVFTDTNLDMNLYSNMISIKYYSKISSLRNLLLENYLKWVIVATTSENKRREQYKVLCPWRSEGRSNKCLRWKPCMHLLCCPRPQKPRNGRDQETLVESIATNVQKIRSMLEDIHFVQKEGERRTM